MASTQKTRRDRLRIVHLLSAALLVGYLYTPLADDAASRAVVRAVIIPALVLTGVVMWKLPALRRLAQARLGSRGRG